MSMKKVAVITDAIGNCWLLEALARKEIDVVYIGNSASIIEKVKQQLENILNEKIRKWSITETEKKVILSRIHFQTGISNLDDIDMIIESITGSFYEKKELIERLEKSLGDDVIIATNALACRVSDFQNDVKHPEKMIGIHFIRHFAEIIKGNKTSNATYHKLKTFVEQLNISSIDVKDSPGNVFNRLTLCFMNEAIDILSEGIVSPEDLDTMLKSVFEWRRGPLEMADRIGLDQILNELDQLYRVTRNKKYLASTYLRNLVADGRTGTVSGEGFFHYDLHGKRLQDTQEVY